MPRVHRNLSRAIYDTPTGHRVLHPAVQRYLQARLKGLHDLAAKYSEEVDALIAHPGDTLTDKSLWFAAFKREAEYA